MNEKTLRTYVKQGIIVLLGLLIAYGFITGSITCETIVELFRGFTDVGG
jgi:hypothetical protein